MKQAGSAIHTFTTHQIIEAIETEDGSFSLPWQAAEVDPFSPISASDIQQYRRDDFSNLWSEADDDVYPVGFWGTCQHTRTHTDQVRDEKSSFLIYRQFPERENGDDEEDEAEELAWQFIARICSFRGVARVDGFIPIRRYTLRPLKRIGRIDRSILARELKTMQNGSIVVCSPRQNSIFIPSFAVRRTQDNGSTALVFRLNQRNGVSHQIDTDHSDGFQVSSALVKDDHFAFDVCVVGGCGHVGLPLAITMASRNLKVSVYDINDRSIALVRSGRMPFLESSAEPQLRKVIGQSLEVSNDPSLISRSRLVVVVTGTPVDEHLNPTYHVMRRTMGELLPRLVDGQCLILRSTVYPGTTEKVRDMVAATGRKIHVAFCPERVAEGKAMEELSTLPQIVAGCDDQAIAMAETLFAQIAGSTIHLTPLEAELTKIFANVWRYIQFAIANQFFMIATDYGLDFYRIHDALTRDYPRMAGLPKSGFAAGPCLFKDTMQLGAATNNNFALGHAAMLINEGLRNFLVRYAKQHYVLKDMRVGVLGMAFKADSDDPRESLSYKLKKILQYEAAEVLCTDVYIADPDFRTLEEVVEQSELLFIGAPHREYRELKLPESKLVIDIWNVFGRGVFPT